MLLPFRLGLGGPLGPGTQYMSWIHRDDWIGLVLWLIAHDLEGAFNGTAPEPVTNAEFAKTLGRACDGPRCCRRPPSRCGSRWARWPTRCCSRASGPCPSAP